MSTVQNNQGGTCLEVKVKNLLPEEIAILQEIAPCSRSTEEVLKWLLKTREQVEFCDLTRGIGEDFTKGSWLWGLATYSTGLERLDIVAVAVCRAYPSFILV